MNVIRQVFETRLKAWADLQVIPIAYEGIPFTPPTSGQWLQISIIPSTTINRTIDGEKIRSVGMVQINCYGRDGHGSATLETLAQNIVNLFPIIPKFSPVSVEQTPSMLPHLVVNDFRIIPVRFRYRYEN